MTRPVTVSSVLRVGWEVRRAHRKELTDVMMTDVPSESAGHGGGLGCGHAPRRPRGGGPGPLGRRLGELTVPTTAKGYERLVCWAEGFGAVRCAGVEGTSSYGAGSPAT